MEISKILQKEQLLIKFYKIKHLILLKVLNMMDIKEDLLLCFTIVFCKPAFNNDQLTKELHKPIIRKLKKTWFILDLKIKFGVLI